MGKVLLYVLLALGGSAAAQGIATDTPQWRFISSMFKQNDIVLVPCPESVATGSGETLCGNYRWGGEAFMRNWTSLSEYHPPVPVTALDDWSGSDGSYQRTFEVDGREVQVRIDGNLVSVSMAGGQ